MSSPNLVSVITDDRDPNIQYLPNITKWTVCTHAEPAWNLYNNSDTFSKFQGAYIQYTFDGDSIEYWGNQGPDHGPCLISIDGIDQQTVNSHAADQDVPILLWSKGNLGSDLNHTIKITVVNASCPNVCEIDRFVVNKTVLVVGSDVTNGDHSDGTNTPPWAAIGGAIGGAVILIALLAFCLFWCCRKGATRTRDIENTTTGTSEQSEIKGGIVLLPSNAVNVTETTEFGDVAATGEHGLSELSPQEQVIDTCNQPFAIGVPTPDSSHPFLSAYAASIAPVTPRPTQLFPVFESHQQQLQQIAPCSFKMAMNGDEAIAGALKEKQQARKEYKQALDAGKMVYLLEQEDPDVFHASLGNIKPGSELEFRIPFVSIAGNNHTNPNPVFSAVAPHHESPSGGPAMPLFDRGQHVNSLNTPKPAEAIGLAAYPVSINLGSPARELSGNWKLPDGFVDSHEFLEKEVVITISPRELDIEGPIVAEGVQGTRDLSTLIEVTHSAPSLLAEQEFLFLVDRSSSMYGTRISQLKAALRILIKSLPDTVMASFNIISFGYSHDSLWPTSKTYSEESSDVAKIHVESMDANYGPGTKLRAALKYTFENRTKRQLNGKPVPVAVFVLTDGETGDTSNIVTTVSQAVAKAERENGLLRVFVLGIGDDVSHDVCENIARAGKGIAGYVGNHGIVRRELLLLLKEARCKDIKDYDVSRAPGGASGSTLLSRSQSHRRQDPNRLTTTIAVDSGGATYLVKIQLQPIGSGPTHGSRGEDMRRNYGETNRLGRQYSSTLSFLGVTDAHIQKVAGSPDHHPYQHSAATPPPNAPQNDFGSPLNRPNPTVESIADAQLFDGSFDVNGDFIRLLTGSSSIPSLPDDLTALPGSVQDKQTIWVALLALAVFAKNLTEDEVSWSILAEKAEAFIRRSLDSLGVDATGINPMVSRLKRAAAKYVAYKFWVPILKRPDSSVVILVISIDG